MPQITIQNINNKTVTFTNSSKTVLQVFQESGIEWMHACGGNGRCTTCKMIIVKGYQNLNAPNRLEEKMKQAGRLNENERLACQSGPSGDLTIIVPEENKLPHITYTS